MCSVQIFVWVPDVNSLQNFVTVALATAAGGEGDMTTDRLTDLRTIGRCFGPLIYNLPIYASFQQLQEHCKTLWETLEHAPNLPEMMVICQTGFTVDIHNSFNREPVKKK